MLRMMPAVLRGSLLQLDSVFLSTIHRRDGSTPLGDVSLGPGRCVLFQNMALLQDLWLFPPPDAEAASKSPR